ncbi:M23 family metallopeptidase [Compostimonas suwonensis]|uniref:Murein DD-endopeptidase MepM/ murein hydrolase activator NlpD n=1 Tax=Compostimonas suwonensis TaxID=1048394 RepID=A0A2M9C4Y1_9MICO|nr:M23 family metallopeptidase [Compostimonas suwonensis]PJJ65590.1 murein DD-endopeptidase MepM/ murein hydrolase activator NlpD [Compostimonas suwonensis]
MRLRRLARLNRTGSTRPLRPRRRLFPVAMVAVLGIALTGAIAQPSFAADYPSWDDVQAAKNNQAAGEAAVANIKNLIGQLQTQVEQTQAEAEKRGLELQVAEQKLFDAEDRATTIQEQADTSQAQADAATQQAGRLAAQLYRAGGGDLSVNIFLDGERPGGQADELLAKLGSMSKLVERSSSIYDAAQIAQNTAASMSAQAEVARGEREQLRVAAQDAMDAANAAAEAAAAALAEQQAQQITLEEQLKALQDTTAKTVAEWQKGEEERRQRELEAARLAAASGGGGGGSGPGPGLPGGYISDSGWAVPGAGRITDGFGGRGVICTGGGCSSSNHRGTDIGTGCSAPIYAAHSGTVISAGPYGTYGNWILIDHGGVQTGYAHIRPGGIFVSVGQQVEVGQNIASSGTTGASTGCHLHFEVRINGTPVNAVPFMAERGAGLG